MLSSTNIGLDLPRDIDPCVNWKTAPKGRRRGTRRVRNSTPGDSNRKKAAMTSSNGSEIASDEEFKEADQVLASESEKLSVTILGRRFSDTIQSVPIKKRMRLQTGSSATLPLDCGQVSTPETGSAFPVEDSSLDHHIDFSGISILADAACKSDEDTNHFSTSEVQSPTTSKGENGVVMPQEAHEIKSPKYDCASVPSEISSTHVVTTEVVNNGLEKSSKAENVSRGSRLHWDLNTVMDAWDCDQQEGGDGADHEQKSSVVACITEMCNDYKEEADKDGDEDHKITCRNDGDVPELASPKSELHGTELRKEDAIFTEVDPKERIVETITHPKDCSVLITPFGPSSTKEEVENKNEPYLNQLSASEHGQLSMCKPSDVKEEIEMAGSITEKPFEVDPQLEPIAGPELILEVCNKEPVACAPGSEPKDALMDNDQTGTNAITGVDIVEHDSMAVDDKPEHDALQTDCGQLAEERNQADLPHIETVLMPTIDNDNGHTTDEKVDQQVDLTASGKFSVEVNKHGNSVEFQSDHNYSNFYPPKKDLEEDDYQYEDGELREPDMPYWETDGFKLAENEHGPHDADERCDKHAVTLDPPQSKENLLVADTGVQPNDCMDNNVIVRMDMESNDQIKLLQNSQANNLSENESAEYMHSSKLKATGWDKQPESMRKNSESPSKQEIVAGASSLRGDTLVCIDTLRSSDDSHRDDSSFVRSRRSKEDELDGRVELNPRASRMHERGIPSRHSDASRREEHWVETRINTGRTRHRTTEFGAPSYAPSNSGNATAASIAKVKSNGFMVAPDGTLVKANGSCSTRKCQNSSSFYQGSPTERDHRGLGSSRERIVSPGRFGGILGGRVGRCAVEPAREQYHRPSIEISPDRRRQRSFSPHRGHIRHISPSHIGSPSRSRTRSPNTWFSPPARGRCLADHEPRHERGKSPIHRLRPHYDDRIGAPIHSNHHFPPHGLRCVNDRRCTSPGNIMRRSPPRNARFYQLDSPPPPLHRQRDDFYHHPVHAARCNGFDHRRGFEEERYELVRPERTFQRNMNGDRFRPHNSSQKSLDSHRRSPPRGFNRGLVGDVNHRGKEDGDSFKYVTGGRHNNGKYEKREVRDRSSGGDDATARRRLP